MKIKYFMAYGRAGLPLTFLTFGLGFAGFRLFGEDNAWDGGTCLFFVFFFLLSSRKIEIFQQGKKECQY